MIEEKILAAATARIHRQIVKLSQGKSNFTITDSIIRCTLKQVAKEAREEGFQEGTVCVEDIVAVAVRDALLVDSTRYLADRAGELLDNL